MSISLLETGREGFSRAEVAKAYGLSVKAVDREIVNNKLKAKRCGRRVILNRSAIASWANDGGDK